jgi:sugar (pentulose or hexulose) kinase
MPKGRPVRNAIFSADARARAYIERWTAEGIDRAAVAVGLCADYPAACAAMTRCSRFFPPNPDLAKTCAAKYTGFTRLLGALAPAWADPAPNGR